MSRPEREALESALAAWRGVMSARLYKRGVKHGELDRAHHRLYVRHVQWVAFGNIFPPVTMADCFPGRT